MSTKNQIQMTEGSITGKLMQFSIPLIFSSFLQLLFNAADIIVVGRFAGDNSLAAVGSTSSLINLLVNVFIGLSVGTNVVAAHYFGAEKTKELQETTHSSIMLSVYSGIILTVIGVFGSKYILALMQAPKDVLSLATLYLRIYFGGITATMIYNFGSALLRAKGDTKRPLYILFIAGVLNLILNLFFVICFSMGVAGVAWATVISQSFSAVCIILILLHEEDAFRLHLSKLGINTQIFIRILKIGLPAGFQGIMFSFSNVIIQSSINSFGAVIIAGNSAAINLEGFIYTSMNGFSQGALTFCSQNMGAGKTDRIRKAVWISQIAIIIVGGILGGIFLLFGRQLLGIYSTTPQVIESGMRRLLVILTTYYLCGIMDDVANCIRGIGHSLMPVISSLCCVCIYRILWLFTLFQIPRFHTPFMIFVTYPISWILCYVVNLIYYNKYMRQIENKKIKSTV